MTAGSDEQVASCAIVGGGSLGLTFAAALAAAGHAVTLLARPASARAILAAGEVEVTGGLERRAPARPGEGKPASVGVLEDPAALPEVTGALFMTKGRQLEGAVASVRDSALARGTSWVAGLQNGVVKDDVLAAAFGPDRVLGAATVLGARRASEHEAFVASLGTTYVGELAGAPSPRATSFCRALVDAGITCVLVDDARRMLWSKFGNAVGIFGVSALTGLSTAELFSRSSLVHAYHALLEEVDAVARAEGVEGGLGDYPALTMRTFLDHTPDSLAELLAARFAGYSGPPSYSSMAQDVAAGRRTEAEQIFGDLVARGARRGVATPRAELVDELVSGIDEGITTSDTATSGQSEGAGVAGSGRERAVGAGKPAAAGEGEENRG